MGYERTYVSNELVHTATHLFNCTYFTIERDTPMTKDNDGWRLWLLLLFFSFICAIRNERTRQQRYIQQDRISYISCVCASVFVCVLHWNNCKTQTNDIMILALEKFMQYYAGSSMVDVIVWLIGTSLAHKWVRNTLYGLCVCVFVCCVCLIRCDVHTSSYEQFWTNKYFVFACAMCGHWIVSTTKRKRVEKCVKTVEQSTNWRFLHAVLSVTKRTKNVLLVVRFKIIITEKLKIGK